MEGQVGQYLSNFTLTSNKLTSLESISCERVKGEGSRRNPCQGNEALSQPRGDGRIERGAYTEVPVGAGKGSLEKGRNKFLTIERYGLGVSILERISIELVERAESLTIDPIPCLQRTKRSSRMKWASSKLGRYPTGR